MSVGKASIKRAASAGTRKTAGASKTTKSAAAAKDIKQSVLTPMNADEIQAKFLSGKNAPENPNRPVRLTEDMPDYLL